MREMVKEFDLEKGEIIPRDRIAKWFEEKYPKIKKATVDAHLLKMSINAPSRIHYSAKPNQDDWLFQIDKGNFRLFDHENDPIPIYEKIIAEHVDEDEIEEEDESLAEFAYESDLKNFLSKNLDVVEQGLRLYDDEGITGIEFPVGGRFIDILTVDEKNDFCSDWTKSFPRLWSNYWADTTLCGLDISKSSGSWSESPWINHSERNL